LLVGLSPGLIDQSDTTDLRVLCVVVGVASIRLYLQ
jgi:hypothetical protein